MAGLICGKTQNSVQWCSVLQKIFWRLYTHILTPPPQPLQLHLENCAANTHSQWNRITVSFVLVQSTWQRMRRKHRAWGKRSYWWEIGPLKERESQTLLFPGSGGKKRWKQDLTDLASYLPFAPTMWLWTCIYSL